MRADYKFTGIGEISSFYYEMAAEIGATNDYLIDEVGLYASSRFSSMWPGPKW